jgi:hypothetical protein
MLGAALALPAIGSAQEYRYAPRYDRDAYHDRDGYRDREYREREYRERLRHERWERAHRGFYDRYGYWHRS